jgi:hypothetical protein
VALLLSGKLFRQLTVRGQVPLRQHLRINGNDLLLILAAQLLVLMYWFLLMLVVQFGVL